MTRIVVLLLVAVALAGCSKDNHGLDPYQLEAFDLPDACAHLDVDDEKYQELKAVGIDENPGSINNSWMTIDGIAPIDNRFTLFDCQLEEEHQIASLALRFADSHAATDWVLAVQEESNSFTAGARCVPQAMVFVDGDVVGAYATISSDWHPALQAHAEAAFQQMLDETGAQDYCR